jgi:hypothetical protein
MSNKNKGGSKPQASIKIKTRDSGWATGDSDAPKKKAGSNSNILGQDSKFHEWKLACKVRICVDKFASWTTAFRTNNPRKPKPVSARKLLSSMGFPKDEAKAMIKEIAGDDSSSSDEDDSEDSANSDAEQDSDDESQPDKAAVKGSTKTHKVHLPKTLRNQIMKSTFEDGKKIIEQEQAVYNDVWNSVCAGYQERAIRHRKYTKTLNNSNVKYTAATMKHDKSTRPGNSTQYIRTRSRVTPRAKPRSLRRLAARLAARLTLRLTVKAVVTQINLFLLVTIAEG